MAKANNIGLMELIFRAFFKKGKKKRENSNGQIILPIKENLKTINLMVKVFLFGKIQETM